MLLFMEAIILKYLVFKTKIIVFLREGWSLCLSPLGKRAVVKWRWADGEWRQPDPGKPGARPTISLHPVAPHFPHGWFAETCLPAAPR